ncbi:MAG: NAD(P)H-dependent oxidoreductase [Clostridiales bacterium]|nr:NAD(P)H-dependent oxidoreductase [Clostridiales bacterium]
MNSNTFIKNILVFILYCSVLFSLTACGSNSESEIGSADISSENETVPESEAYTAEASSENETAEPVETGSESLVVYFSWSGNTETIANEIAVQTGADIFELVPVTPYSDDYDTVLDEAKAEQNENTRPEINGSIENFDSYDVIYLGFPNWWGDMPMILYSFLDNYDLSGKTVAPFVSSGGSGFSNTLSTIAENEPEAEITEGLSLSDSESKEPSDAVTEWLGSIGVIG